MPGPAPQSLTFPRDARLLAGIDFARVFQQGKRVSHPLLALHWAPPSTPAGAGARLGLAVSRKVDRRAVVRNRIKRRLRERFRRLRPLLVPGDYVLVARSPAAQADAVALGQAFEALLQRAGALPPSPMPGTMAGSLSAQAERPVRPPQATAR